MFGWAGADRVMAGEDAFLALPDDLGLELLGERPPHPQRLRVDPPGDGVAVGGGGGRGLRPPEGGPGRPRRLGAALALLRPLGLRQLLLALLPLHGQQLGIIKREMFVSKVTFHRVKKRCRSYILEQ